MPTTYQMALKKVLIDTKLNSIEEWAEYLRVTPETVNNWLQGYFLPTDEQTKRIVWAIQNTDDSEANTEYLIEWQLAQYEVMNANLKIIEIETVQ
jgi:hypothetical protein